MRTATLPGTGSKSTRPDDYDPGWENRKRSAEKKKPKKPKKQPKPKK